MFKLVPFGFEGGLWDLSVLVSDSTHFIFNFNFRLEGVFALQYTGVFLVV